MLSIVAAHIPVEPQQRESYLAGCVSIVEQARRATGCFDVAITADLIGLRVDGQGLLLARRDWARCLLLLSDDRCCAAVNAWAP